MKTTKNGLYANIHAKKERIAYGSKDYMRKPSEPGAPKTEDFEKAKESSKTKKNGK